jgi:hypothetical protein
MAIPAAMLLSTLLTEILSVVVSQSSSLLIVASGDTVYEPIVGGSSIWSTLSDAGGREAVESPSAAVDPVEPARTEMPLQPLSTAQLSDN